MLDLIVLRTLTITKVGLRALHAQTERWHRLVGLVRELLPDESS